MNYLKSLVALFVVLFITGCVEDEKLVYKKGIYPTKECKEEQNEGTDFREADKIDEIIVHKKEREMYLMKDGEKLHTFQISLGKNPNGNKVKSGDHKTPLGCYAITKKQCHPKYYRMINISYPNETDRQKAKERGVDPGNGITIHAQPFWNNNGKGDNYTLKKDWTNGCIAITNSSMDILWYALKKGTPITIKE